MEKELVAWIDPLIIGVVTATLIILVRKLLKGSSQPIEIDLSRIARRLEEREPTQKEIASLDDIKDFSDKYRNLKNEAELADDKVTVIQTKVRELSREFWTGLSEELIERKLIHNKNEILSIDGEKIIHHRRN